MKSIDKIPTSKIQRATRIIKTGAKVGVNYVNYYTSQIHKSEKEAKLVLDESNASDIYDGLSTLKGGALKVAQMLSMEKNILPNAYVEKFSLSQFSVPPLSPPLVNKTIHNYFGKYPNELFDEFTTHSVNAASIGQVHKARNGDNELAVKIQYPGVAESIRSDLAIIKPIALRMFNISSKNSDKYFKEVEGKLLEETDYELELEQSIELSEACSWIPGITFPKYYPSLSSSKVLTMDWMNGLHLSEFIKTDPSQEVRNKIGQTLWDFYMFQIHSLKKVHADPHPGNFLISEDNELIVIDFGCVKTISESFYTPYFEVSKKETLENKALFNEKLIELEIIKPEDSQEEIRFFSQLFHELLSLFTRPFHDHVFDFSDDAFFAQITELANKYSKSDELKSMDPNRGSKHFIYMNRSFFGLYNLLYDLKAKDIKIDNLMHEVLVEK